MSKSFRIGIAGLGTVGVGVVKIIQKNADLLEQRCGRPIEIICVSARSKDKDRGVDLSAYEWVDNTEDMAGIDGIDAVVELVGGSEGVAYSLTKQALENGVHVVTANKALVANHGYELASLAEGRDVSLSYEAAVAGGIPVIKALREGFAANRISSIYGILNGTCNYILTDMRETGAEFEDSLVEAQEKGYAEADPSFDIDGVDAGHKICLLASIAFGVKPEFSAVRMTGIRRITGIDIKFAGELGYKLKLLGIARDQGGKLNISVEPCLVPNSSPLAAIEDVYNAVFINGDFVDTPLLTGRGAGEGPTASAVVADIIDLARGFKVPTFGIPADKLKDPVFIDQGEILARYYLRLSVVDQPGVIADVSAILRDYNISIESMVQHGRAPGQAVSVVMTTHKTKYIDIESSCVLIAELETLLDFPCVMRLEDEL
ncbi:MAG: homoserine dehydrogenase [Alphaproteobacteria bacterium]|nr:homoserine dehydrogenase [Alphaproteobacteria bacterium]